ncbi:MAG: pantetheine-phosphate adenylyltransferase [Marvinbryantia sp.]|jgi:pantetheine-phosphate adenylyltransferase
MKRAVYPGSFDPVTYGHLDVIRRSAALVDELIVGVLQNNNKNPLFSSDERVRILHEVTKDMKNVRVEAFSGLSIDFVKEKNAQFLVRGLRAITDFDYELQMAQTNRIMAPDIDTIFLTTSLEYAYLSSSTLKEVAFYGGDISKFAPEIVREAVRERMAVMRTQNKKQ